ncbi:MAG: hypothetical protein FD167_4663 [bacterium]|nr:MAG: hypothetical protein FD167_4663 [bacterium]
MTKKEASLFKLGWQIANQQIEKENSQQTIEVKLQQLAVIFGFGKKLSLQNTYEVQEQQVYQIWQKLKER